MNTSLPRSAAGKRWDGVLSARGRRMLSKVPEVTFSFWVINVLCTTVGETASEYLDGTLGLGLTNTTYITATALVAALVAQFRLRSCVPSVYWLAVVLIGLVGTQLTDNLVDNFGVSLAPTTTEFAIALAGIFAAWFASEGTLSIHTIHTPTREAFYWAAILLTFALGTAACDVAAGRINLPYWLSAVMFGVVIVAVAAAYYRLRLNAVLAFWIAYVLIRPLGASLGDYLSQHRADGGLGLGTSITSGLSLGTILLVVAYLNLTRKDTRSARPLRES